jgi:hypothetical protein
MIIFASGAQSQTRDEIRSALQSKNYEVAFPALLKLAEQGDGAAQALVSSMYRAGHGTAKNEQAGFEWAKKAAEQVNVQGQFLLGITYSTGQGVQKDEALGFYWYNKALEGGHQYVHGNLASMYRRGVGVPQDYQKAIEIFKKGIANNHPSNLVSYLNLALMYERGEGVSVDLMESLRLLNLAKNRPNVSGSTAASIQASIDRVNQKNSLISQSIPSIPLQNSSIPPTPLTTDPKSLFSAQDPRLECEIRFEKDTRLSSISSKISLRRPSDIGFTMLADLSLPNAAEQRAIALYADNIRKCIKEAEIFRRQNYSSAMMAIISKFDSDFNDATIELYNKKITYGKYNKKIQQLDSDLNDGLGKIAIQVSDQKKEQEEANKLRAEAMREAQRKQEDVNKARAEAMREAQRRQDQARAEEVQRQQQQRQAELDRVAANRNRWVARCNLDKANAFALGKVRYKEECDNTYRNASNTALNRMGVVACIFSIDKQAEEYAQVTFDACMSGAP